MNEEDQNVPPVDDESSVDQSPPVKRPRVNPTSDQASDSPLTFRRLLRDMVNDVANEEDREYFRSLPRKQQIESCCRDLVLHKANVDALITMAQTLEEDLAVVKERNIALENDLAAVRESLEAKVQAAEAKLAESERLAAFERARAEEGQRLLEDSRAQHEKNMEELRAEHATRLEEFHKAVDVRLREARDEGRLQGFNTCLEQFMNLAHLPEGIDLDFLNLYADGMGRLDGEDGARGQPPSEAAVLAHLIKDAVLSVELRKKFIAALESLFAKPLEVDSLFFRRATFRASSGRFTFLVHFSLSLQFPEHQPVLLLESSQYFDAQGVPVKSQNLAQYPWSLRWEASEMAGQIFDFLAEEGLSFKKYCNQLNHQ